MGLLGAAAVGGTAYYAGKKVTQGRQAEDMQDQQIADLQDQAAYQQQAAYTQPPPPAPPPAAAPGAGSDTATQLQQLAKLHDSGALSDEEFATAKKQVLSGG
jgi:hypothetical protein